MSKNPSYPMNLQYIDGIGRPRSARRLMITVPGKTAPVNKVKSVFGRPDAMPMARGPYIGGADNTWVELIYLMPDGETSDAETR